MSLKHKLFFSFFVLIMLVGSYIIVMYYQQRNMPPKQQIVVRPGLSLLGAFVQNAHNGTAALSKGVGDVLTKDNQTVESISDTGL